MNNKEQQKQTTVDTACFFAREITACWDRLGSTAAVQDTTEHIVEEISEFLDAETLKEKSEELADVIILCTYWLIQNGFNPADVIEHKGNKVLTRHKYAKELLESSPYMHPLEAYNRAKQLEKLQDISCNN